jgi:hypothetical protein
MLLQLPKLDDRTYAELVAEARTLIPTYDLIWTDHNPSDPGITLIELFAWLTEMLIYRVDQIPDGHQLAFLRLLNGPDWRPGPDLAEDIRASVIDLRRCYRAVTVDDYETLARQASDQVGRAKCVPGRDLTIGTEEARATPRPGRVSLIIVPDHVNEQLQPDAELVGNVASALEPGRLLTTRLHVVGPVYAPVHAEILIARRADIGSKELEDQVTAGVKTFLSCLAGGPGGQGWPFGRDIYVSELYELLERLRGVDYVPDIALTSQCDNNLARCVAAPELWHDNGNQIGLGLAAYLLPYTQDDWLRIFSATAFIPVRLTIAVHKEETATLADVRRGVKATLRQRFHPLHDGPDGSQAWGVTMVPQEAIPPSVQDGLSQYQIITIEELRTLVGEVPQVKTVDALTVESVPPWLLLDSEGRTIAVLSRSGELADLAIDVTVT